MSETVHNVTTLPAESKHLLKRIAKKTAIASIAAVALAAIYLKVTQDEEETVNDPTSSA